MLELLKEVEKKTYDAVLVMDIQRVGRGDMEEQGIILKTFKNSKTKIITPEKIYNLSNEFDEEYSEFEAFMSRKEYRMITRRMQGGRIRSVQKVII
jgi:DNA invertase Pin-like site-specific DNA recombinase